MEHSFSSDELEQLKGVNADLRESLDKLFMLQSFPEEIAGFAEKEEVFSALLSLIPKIVNCYYCQIVLYSQEEFSKVEESVYQPGMEVKAVDSELMTWACQRGKITVLPGLQPDEGKALVPLLKGTRILGVIILELGKYYDSFSGLTHLTLTTLANYAAFALAHIESTASLRKKMARLEDQRNYIEGVLNQVDCPIVALNPDGIIKLMNQKAEAFFGIRSKIAIGNPHTVAMPPGLQGLFSELLLKIQSNNPVGVRRFSFSTPSGEERGTLVHAASAKVAGSSRPGLVCAFHELTGT